MRFVGDGMEDPEVEIFFSYYPLGCLLVCP